MKISRTKSTMVSSLRRMIYNFTINNNPYDLLLNGLYSYSAINGLFKMTTYRLFKKT